MNLMERFRSHVHATVDGTGLALFRITYSMVLLFEVIQLFYFRQLIFDTVPFQDGYVIDFTLPLLAWMGLLLCLIAGYRTRFVTVANYLMSLVFISKMHDFEYHIMYSYMGLNFLLMFLPVSHRLSLDNIRLRLKHGGRPLPAERYRVTKLAYTLPLLLGIGLVYLDSVLYKFSSEIWMKGLGVWYPASIPQLTHVTWQSILNQELLMKFLGYLTIAFEGAFVFLFWFRRMRWPLFIVGIGLHVGIFIFFPIPFFALAVCAMYLILVPSSTWHWVLDRFIVSSKPPRVIQYDPLNAKHRFARAILEQLDLRRRLSWQPAEGAQFMLSELHGKQAVRSASLSLPFGLVIWIILCLPGVRVAWDYACTWLFRADSGETAPSTPIPAAPRFIETQLGQVGSLIVIAAFTFMQINSLSFAPVGRQVRAFFGLNQPAAMKASITILAGSKALFGITRHPLFMDSHYAGYNHIVAVIHQSANGEETLLPLIEEDGRPGWYAYGMNWANLTFRVNAGAVSQENMSTGLERFSTFWSFKQDVPLEDRHFQVVAKHVDLPPKQWTRDFLINQRDNPWQPAGNIAPDDEGFLEADLVIIESIGPVEDASE